MSGGRRSRLHHTAAWPIWAAVILLAIVVSACSGGGDKPAARGVANISADDLVQRGIYLGPPGTLPAGASPCADVLPATTTGPGTSVSTTPAVGSEQQAVQGDPADGKAKVTSRTAIATSRAEVGGFVGTVRAGTPALVQLKDIYACIVATAWAVPLTGMAQLSCGPVPTHGGTTRSCQPSPSTTIVFIDAVTGKLISAPGFG
jgi:hypothetical protein